MITGSERLWTKEEYTYPVMGDFIPTIHWYIHDEDETIRKAMVVNPGGGYRFVSPTEGEIVALKFYELGYNAFVVTYTVNMTHAKPLKFQPLMDASAAITYVRRNADKFHIAPNRVTACGFSAGGHLTASLAVHFDAPEVQAIEKCRDNRPDAVILSYPVITSGKYAHRDSFVALLGADATAEELEYMSLEKQVDENTSPAFLWQTATDELVPVQNSYYFAESCLEHHVPFEHHVFVEGHHGLSLADETWASGNYGGTYTMDQMYAGLQAMVDAGQPLPAPFDGVKVAPSENVKEAFEKAAEGGHTFGIDKQVPNEEVTIWPILADRWLKKLWNE